MMNFKEVSLKSKSVSDLILQISRIGEMHQFLIVYKHHKGRRLYRYLGHVVNL